MPATNLMQLPTELLLGVFTGLEDIRDAVRLGGVCQRLRDIWISDTERIALEILHCGEQAIAIAKTEAGISGRPIDLGKPNSAAISSGWSVRWTVVERRDDWLPTLLRNASLAKRWVECMQAWLQERARRYGSRNTRQLRCFYEAYYRFRQMALAYSDQRQLCALLAKLEVTSKAQFDTYWIQLDWMWDEPDAKDELKFHDALKDPDAYMPDDLRDIFTSHTGDLNEDPVLRDDWGFASDVVYQYMVQDVRVEEPFQHKLDTLVRPFGEALDPDPPPRWTALQPELASRMNGIARDRHSRRASRMAGTSSMAT